MDNYISIPELNPVIFYETTRQNLPRHFTKFMGEFMFSERQYVWQQREDYTQVWQTTDIINLQFSSTFDPIIVKLVNQYGEPVITLPALIGLPNKFLPGTFSFEINMSLGSVETGYYRLQIELGSEGPMQKILISDCQFISSEPIPNTISIDYFNSKFRGDVIFETGIKFQLRLFGHFGFLEKSRKDEMYRDEKYTSTILNSKSAKQWPVYFGDEYGIPDEVVNIIDEIWACDNVSIDGKPFGIAEGAKFEYIFADEGQEYPKRGMKLMVEAGINRNSRIYEMGLDLTKKLVSAISVDARVFGDVSNQGSSNTVPVYNVEIE